MATLVIMPRQGQSVESCIITEWKKKKGDKVAVKDVLFSYETDKSAFDEEAAVAGTLLEVFVKDGDDVPCLDPVCIIGEPGEDISALVAQAKAGKGGEAPAPEEKKPEAEAPAAAPAQTAAQEVPAAPEAGGFLRISPRARKLAEKTGADVSKAEGTGPMGRIIERDVNALLDRGLTVQAAAKEAAAAAEAVQAPAASAPAATPAAAYEDVKMPNIRKVIARAMHASLSNMAQLTLNASFDATQIMAFRAAVKAAGEGMGMNNITLNDIVLYAVARTLPGHRDLNANYFEDKEIIRYFSHVNLGVAVDTPRGLLVPTVFSADTLSLNELSAEAKKVIKSAQAGTISPDLLKDGSFTVTNLGSLGVESFTPVINPPQTAILGVDCITRRVKNVGGQDVFYDAMGLSLTFDHRVLDGAPAAKFLKELCFNLENFNLLLAK
jgi:pyruvate dehydrogenase E2 component (dihydrolipoamide acetyltransferase)